jgi:serine/threonine protein kinase
VGATVLDQDRLRTALADRYELDREIGAGGMAHVYHAYDRQHGRDVAIKVMRPELSAAIGVERFLREIRIEARLQHPNILPLYDSGVADGLLYYVMPYVEGESLRERIRREKQLSVPEAIRIAREVADALDYAHRHNVVHRDIKPGNILLSGGHPLVADFGLARAVSAADEESLTASGIAVGTAEYMSPEQASGESDVDGRSDIYALGCVLYEMLAGDPPFTGRTVQSVLARHRHDPPPRLSVVRPGLSPQLEEAVERSLAKVPADRFATAAELAAALAASASLPRIATQKSFVRRRARFLVLAGIAVISVVGIWWTLFRRPPAGDPNKVMVFPLVERGSGTPSGIGEEVAILIGSALEHTEPLKWIDGWTWLDPEQRGDIRMLSARAARATALAQGAGYYVDGSVVRSSDSTTIVLRLHDNVGDSVVGQASASAAATTVSPAQVGLRAVTQLLTMLLQPGHNADPTALNALASRAPAAIANWLQGERESRRSRFGAALRYYRRAVAEDTLLAVAALRGAEAAWWMERAGEEDSLARLAVAHASALPQKYAELAYGLANYLDGEADSALAHIQSAVRSDSAMSVAWMMLGEVYYHLFPTIDRPLASLSQAAFETARRVDPGFTPPLYHLTEMALRRGDLARAKQFVAEYQRSGAEAQRVDQLQLMVACAEHGSSPTLWAAGIGKDPAGALQAAKSLSAGGAFPDCAIAGFKAVLQADRAALSVRWGAVMGLQSMLVARGQIAQAETVLDSAAANGMPAANALFVLDALAGAGLDARANAAVRQLAGPYAGMSSSRLWFLGAWAAHQGAVGRLDSIAQTLETLAARSGDKNDAMVARSMSGRLALLQADTVSAIEALESLRQASPAGPLTWGFWEALGGERIALAQLLEAKGRKAEALRVAEEFDHPDPVTYLLYLPASLRLRIRAAQGIGNDALVRDYRNRLEQLSKPTS